MSLQETLRNAGKQIEQALAAGLFAKADSLLREYNRCLETLSPSAPDREAVLRESSELLENLRRMALAARAAAAAQLNALPSAARMRYGAPAARTRNSWEMSG